ncbi:MAG: phage tail protein [Acidimicrobiales bacterium]
MAKSSGRVSDPLTGFTFGLDIDGVTVGFFMEVSGIGSSNEVIEHKVVDQKGHELVQKIPGRMTWEDITLKRGVTDAMDMWDWRANVEQGKMTDARKNGSVVMYDRNYEELARWNFENGWPSKISGPSLDTGSTDVGVEEITIVHEGITRTK